MIEKEKIEEKLKEVKDPELGIDVLTLGLVYDIKQDDDGIEILMTLTTPFCPFADQMIAEVEAKVTELITEEGKTVRVELTFDPPWEASKELRDILGV